VTISINQLASGTGLRIGGDIFVVIEYHHVKPGKGAAFARVRVKNIKTDQVLERTFRSSDKLDDVPLEEKRLQNLYRSGDSVHFMDHSTYEEVIVPLEIIGKDARFLQENLEVTAVCCHNEILKIILPTFIIAEVTHAEPGFKGDSTRSGTKPATIDTGTMIQVPLFINPGDRLKIDTRTGTYVERAQK
jgi:elongation factor P